MVHPLFDYGGSDKATGDHNYQTAQTSHNTSRDNQSGRKSTDVFWTSA